MMKIKEEFPSEVNENGMDIGDDDEDPIIEEFPVFLNEVPHASYHILEYASTVHKANEVTKPSKANVKPNSGLLEMEFSIANSNTVDEERSNHLGDYSSKSGSSSETLVYRGFMEKNRCICVGTMDNNGLHITPCLSKISLKPNLDISDQSNSRKKDNAGNDENESKEHIVRQKFERTETERSKFFKERTFAFYKKNLDSESWKTLEFENTTNSNRLHSCNVETTNVPFYMEKDEYVANLTSVPLKEKRIHLYGKICKSYQEAVEHIIRKLTVVRFGWIQGQLGCAISNEELIKAVTKFAVLIQGVWVLRSTLAYTAVEDEDDNEIIQSKIRDRDLMLCLLSEFGQFELEDLRSRTSVDFLDVLSIMEPIIKHNSKTATLKVPRDAEFIKMHPKICAAHQSYWRSFYKNFKVVPARKT